MYLKRATLIIPLFVWAMLSSTAIAQPLPASETVSAVTYAKNSSWTLVAQETRGSWEIARENNQFVVMLGPDFQTAPAEDLKLYLSKQNAQGLTDRNGINATILIGRLTSNIGPQKYPLPATVNPMNFASLILYCESCGKLWAAANLY